MTHTLHIAMIGPGLVGSEFLSQVAAYQHRALSLPPLSKPLYNLVVVGIASSTRHLISSNIDLLTWKKALAESPSSSLSAFLDHASKHTSCVLVDATSNNDIAESYPDLIAKYGLHIVTPNKKAFSGDLTLYQRITSLAAKHNKHVRHEATVGAGLPILCTLNDLVQTGDDIVKIEGIFSGTLSYIFNSFSTPTTAHGKQPLFSDVVQQAKQLGYTEPDPRDDLNGMDVARKVVILARIAGLDLSVDTLPIENIVPQPLQTVATSDEFMSLLSEHDKHFDMLNQQAAEQGSVLRYVGQVDIKNKCGSVKLAMFPFSHPFAGMKGSENVIAFTTKRFPVPLIIQGAGAGAAVTAFGMMSDLLKIAETVQ
ncbi:homoserine dehydrogenase, variant [Batrachochytrium dendrobatidis JEL423]|uniref:Homoserine dehydrogenase n=1 Tax=Batrachochytrium dendrobatidis (strain JEL423) TaxID=403673 RepID=A0A177WI02_BATDL|nr:homoserine dehydrogenase [Batrachochytrium dendrobatidis JEL423]OAJ39693.1 homoserine dehydrogenase, variant [Batrachochytrium dendrobatidis JEL423]